MNLATVTVNARLLRSLREDAGISQANAAREVGISRQQLWNYEQGLFKPPVDVLARLCRLYGVSMDSLIEESGTAIA